MKNHKMTIKKAYQILGYSSPIPSPVPTLQELKKKYYELALKYHPDKRSESIEDTANTFKEINEAYHFLLSKPIPTTIDMDYMSIVSEFISTFMLKSREREIFIQFLHQILQYGQNRELLKQLLLKFNIDILHFIKLIYSKYSHMFPFPIEVIEMVDEILVENQHQEPQHQHIILLNPFLHDLFEERVFIYPSNSSPMYIPLWHKEMAFEPNIVVQCNPICPSNIYIDEHNHLHIQIEISIFECIDLFRQHIDFYSYMIPNNEIEKTFQIPLHKIKMTHEEQEIILPNMGIPAIHPTDFFDVSIKSDVIFHLLLSNM